jgi:Flp pilus assembly protein TadD
MEQQRYDEAEAAWKRALAIDWRYSLARMNLKGLKDVRRGKQVAKAVLVESYEGGKVKKKFVLNEEKPEL